MNNDALSFAIVGKRPDGSPNGRNWRNSKMAVRRDFFAWGWKPPRAQTGSPAPARHIPPAALDS
ncbi:MAG: hypothetical protein ALAOOOJD_00910 [bacterium]|nr:hypothetical protein [bacterium]